MYVAYPYGSRSFFLPDMWHLLKQSLPISSVLSKLTVSSATDPSPSTLAQPITLTEPPFIITSTTNEAFLARLAFTWAGTMNAETEIEHWVEVCRLSSAAFFVRGCKN